MNTDAGKITSALTAAKNLMAALKKIEKQQGSSGKFADSNL